MLFKPSKNSHFELVFVNTRRRVAIITKKHLFDEYMQWLFNILFTLEKRIDISNYDSYQKRVYGFLSERLFNVWIEKNKDRLKIKETTVIFLEKINAGIR